MRRISRPDYYRAEIAAYKVLELSQTRELPVKVKKIANYFPNLRIKSYSWFAKTQGMTIEEVVEFADSNEGCCYYKKSTHQYLILYNDTIDSVGRIRWTIAHELGHYMLKHNEESDKTILSRNSLTHTEYETYEKEANSFARTLLAPSIIIRALDPPDPLYISKICGLSLEASNNVFSFFKEGLKKRQKLHEISFKVVMHFKDYINKQKHTKYCIKCSYSFVDKTANYCPVCGNNNLMKGQGDNMQYTKIKLDEFHRAVSCPICENENIVGDYCHICGAYLINKCTGFADDPMNRYTGPWHKEFQNSCGKLLDGDARFCSECGSVSTFYESGILKHWAIEKKEIESVENEGEIVDDDFSENIFR